MYIKGGICVSSRTAFNLWLKINLWGGGTLNFANVGRHAWNAIVEVGSSSSEAHQPKTGTPSPSNMCRRYAV